MLWEIDIYPVSADADRTGLELAHAAAHLGLAGNLQVHSARGYLLEGLADEDQANSLAQRLLADPVTDRVVIGLIRSPHLNESPGAETPLLVHVLPKPAVMDPVALSVIQAARELGFPLQAVRTFKKYWLSPLADGELNLICKKLLANEAIEEWKIGPLELDRLELGGTYQFELLTESLEDLHDPRFGHLSLSQPELETIQAHFHQQSRNPTDAELETIAQTWSEHCSHKTLAGRIAYRDPQRELIFDNMLRETIFDATCQIREALGEDKGDRLRTARIGRPRRADHLLTTACGPACPETGLPPARASGRAHAPARARAARGGCRGPSCAPSKSTIAQSSPITASSAETCGFAALPRSRSPATRLAHSPAARASRARPSSRRAARSRIA